MNEKINQIIKELVSLDPEFGKHRPELEKIIVNLLAIKPDVVVDADFTRSLRLQLLNQLDQKSNSASTWSLFKGNFMKKTIIPALSVMALLVVTIAGLEMYGSYKNKSGLNLLSFGSDVRVIHTGDKAFGNLATLVSTSGQGGGGSANSATPAAPLGSDTRSLAPSGMGGGGGINEKMIAPYYEPVTYKYVYKGDDLNLSSDKLDVLKKQTVDTSALAGGLSNLGLGLISLDSFPGSKVQSVSFNQDNGYNIYVDFNSGMVSLSGYYGIMPLADGATKEICPTDGCNPTPVEESDIPDDSTIISIANQFLSDHGISTASYGTPEVMNDFRVQNYETLKANSKALVYWPDYINVVYPLKIQDGEVYDESGSKTGMMVGVTIRNNKVTSVSNLTTLNYEASSYDAETDKSRILKVAENGGMYNYYYGDNSAKVVEIELGTPTMQYVQMWDYQNNISQQLLVPSLVFPITKQPEDGNFWRKSVVVPLIKNILDRDNGNSGSPIKTLQGTAVPPRAAK
jgi:hypothetical protein